MYKLKTIREVVKICFANVFPEISLVKYEKITVCFLFYFSFINVWIQLSPFSHHHFPQLHPPLSPNPPLEFFIYNVIEIIDKHVQ